MLRSPHAAHRLLGFARRIHLTPKRHDSPPIASLNNTIDSLMGRSQVAEPHFSVVATGSGSLLRVDLPVGSRCSAVLGCIVGMSSKVVSEISMIGGILRAAKRKLAGGSMYMQTLKTSDESVGDVLLAPHGLGDIAVVALDGSSSYLLRRGAFLAGSPNLSISAETLPRFTTQGIAAVRVRGRGSLALTAYGGLFRVALDKNEEYIASVNHVVAWDKSLTITPSDIDASRLQTPSLWKRIVSFVRPTIDQRMCRIVGPGDVFIASRIAPRFDSLRKWTNSSSASDGYTSIASPVVQAKSAPVEVPADAQAHDARARNSPLKPEVGAFSSVLGEDTTIPVRPTSTTVLSKANK